MNATLDLEPLCGRRRYDMGLPLKFRAATGSPIRAMAWIPE
jgi:kynurenine formamidase